MKNVLTSFAIVCCLLTFFNSCQARCEMLSRGVVYLKVLDENGIPLPDTYEENLILKNYNMDRHRQSVSKHHNPPLILNEKDELIFQLGTVTATYTDCKRLQKRDGFTDEEIVKALEGVGIFTIKDKSGKYKTVVDIKYTDCYVSLERIKSENTLSYIEPEHVYHCEIKLEKMK